jgi:adenylate cyclase
MAASSTTVSLQAKAGRMNDEGAAHELNELRERFELRNMVDELIEEGLVKRWSVGVTLAALLPRLTARLGLRGAFVETYGEDLELRRFSSPEGLAVPRDAVVWAQTSVASRERVDVAEGGLRVVAQHLDVAGTWFGRAGFVVDGERDAGLAPSLHAVCEVLDNFLFTIRAAREKHAVMMELGDALRERVLREGIQRAVAVLARAVPFERLVMVYVAEERSASALHLLTFRGARLEVDTISAEGADPALRDLARRYLDGVDAALLAELGVRSAQEEVLINGVSQSVVVGKIVVTSASTDFNTTDRELLSAFAGYIRQRIVDFGKEWRALAYAFRPDDVARLLQHDDYERRFLTPREAVVGVVYIDISGFTAVSETVLQTPARVAELVEAWSREAVELVWRHGGVFDKMVGDCIIALFGPPFYEETPGERAARAIRCAVDVRAMTQAIPLRAGFEALRPAGLAVSTGVNLAPLFVGQFGPNANFTGFSSGMNNTARLQGCAGRDEILVMDDTVAALPPAHGFSFGALRSAPVKNVAQPLTFRALRDPVQ